MAACRSSGSRSSGSARCRSRSRSPRPTCTWIGRPASAAACTPNAASSGEISRGAAAPVRRTTMRPPRRRRGRRAGTSRCRTRTGRRRSSSRRRRAAPDPRSRERNSSAYRCGSTLADERLGDHLQAEHLECRATGPRRELVRRAQAVRPESGVHHPPRDPAAGKAARRRPRPEIRAAAPVWSSASVCRFSPSGGAHQRRIANPTWLSNWVCESGIGSVDASLIDSSNARRSRGIVKQPWTWWSTSGRLTASASSSGMPRRPAMTSRRGSHPLNASRKADATSAGSEVP